MKTKTATVPSNLKGPQDLGETVVVEKQPTFDVPERIQACLEDSNVKLTTTNMILYFKRVYSAVHNFYDEKLGQLLSKRNMYPEKYSKLMWTCQRPDFDFNDLRNEEQMRDSQFNMYEQLGDSSTPSKITLLQAGFIMYRSLIRYLGYSLPLMVESVPQMLELIHAVSSS